MMTIALTLRTRSIVQTIQSRSQSGPERESHFPNYTDRTIDREAAPKRIVFLL
jgi:hypothetical protein